jgi:SIT family siderophore-iron:H+ symporter-like MFS transporter
MAAITAGWLLVYYIAGGIGSAIGGGIWTNLVPGKLDEYFTNSTLAASAYANPTGFIRTYLPGTPERMAIARAHDETQRILVITGMCVSAAALVTACLLPNVRLPDTQSMHDEEDHTVLSERADHKNMAPVSVDRIPILQSNNM